MARVVDKSPLFKDTSASSLAWLMRECTQDFGVLGIRLAWLRRFLQLNVQNKPHSPSAD